MENQNEKIAIAIVKLHEYAYCGLSCNSRDTDQAKEWIKIIREAISNRPPNTAMQIDTTPCIAQVHSVYRINGAKYCKDCGQDLRLIPVINS